MKRQYFAVLDTETTLNDTVMDFAIVVCDRHGKIYNSCSVLVRESMILQLCSMTKMLTVFGPLLI